MMNRVIISFMILTSMFTITGCTGVVNDCTQENDVSLDVHNSDFIEEPENYTEKVEDNEDATEILVFSFEKNGYQVICRTVEQQILSGERYQLDLNKDGVQNLITFYSYENSLQAKADTDNIKENGTRFLGIDGDYSTETYVTWKNTPHFYILDNLIIQYIGNDEDIISVLTDLCGEAFTEG